MRLWRKNFGANAKVGIRKKPPKAPKFSKIQPFTSSKYALKINDLVNVVVFSEDDMMANDDIKQRSKNRGIDFKYDTVLQRITVSVRFNVKQANDDGYGEFCYTLLLNNVSLDSMRMTVDNVNLVQVGNEFEVGKLRYQVSDLNDNVNIKCVCVYTSNEINKNEVDKIKTYSHQYVNNQIIKFIE